MAAGHIYSYFPRPGSALMAFKPLGLGIFIWLFIVASPSHAQDLTLCEGEELVLTAAEEHGQSASWEFSPDGERWIPICRGVTCSLSAKVASSGYYRLKSYDSKCEDFVYGKAKLVDVTAKQELEEVEMLFKGTRVYLKNIPDMLEDSHCRLNINGQLLPSESLSSAADETKSLSMPTAADAAIIAVECRSGDGCYEVKPRLLLPDADVMASAPKSEDCQVEGGTISLNGSDYFCLNSGEAALVQLQLDGGSGNLGRFGLLQAGSLNVLAQNQSGVFDLSAFPPGNYVLAHVFVDDISVLSGVENASQLSGCFGLSNTLSVKTEFLDGGSISPEGPITLSGGSIDFEVQNASGDFRRWLLLNEDFSTLIQQSMVGSFSLDGLPVGNYKAVHAAIGANLDLLELSFGSDVPCVSYSNVVDIIVIGDEGSCPAQVVDLEGNGYSTVQIGGQCWMSENLNTATFDNGEEIPLVESFTAWEDVEGAPAWCYYNNDAETYGSLYGKLYNWFAVVDERGLCPAGWRVPTDDDFQELENFLILNGFNYSDSVSGNRIAKSLAAADWWLESINPGAVGNAPDLNNSTGFTALPGGFRDFEGSFLYADFIGFFWTSTEQHPLRGFARRLVYGSSRFITGRDAKRDGFSVRCLKEGD